MDDKSFSIFSSSSGGLQVWHASCGLANGGTARLSGAWWSFRLQRPGKNRRDGPSSSLRWCVYQGEILQLYCWRNLRNPVVKILCNGFIHYRWQGFLPSTRSNNLLVLLMFVKISINSWNEGLGIYLILGRQFSWSNSCGNSCGNQHLFLSHFGKISPYHH